MPSWFGSKKECRSISLLQPDWITRHETSRRQRLHLAAGIAALQHILDGAGREGSIASFLELTSLVRFAQETKSQSAVAREPTIKMLQPAYQGCFPKPSEYPAAGSGRSLHSLVADYAGEFGDEVAMYSVRENFIVGMIAERVVHRNLEQFLGQIPSTPSRPSKIKVATTT